jgi:putative intracellular protease/amidase
MSSDTPSVLVPLAEGFEELEAITIIDLLRRAGLDVVTAGLAEETVRAEPGADDLNADGRLRNLLSRMAETGRYAAAICAAGEDAGHLDLVDELGGQDVVTNTLARMSPSCSGRRVSVVRRPV